MVDLSSASLYTALALLAVAILVAAKIRHGPILTSGPDALKRPAASDPLSHAVATADRGDFRAVLLLLAAELRRRMTFLSPGAEGERRGLDELARRLQARAGAGKVEPPEAEEWIAGYRTLLNGSRGDSQRP